MIDGNLLEQLSLSPEDIILIKQIDSVMQFFSDLMESDLFIDCYDDVKKEIIVVAQSKPLNNNSLYNGIFIGEIVSHENEPAVYTVLSTGVSVRDIRALIPKDLLIPENNVVSQDIVPIKNKDNKVIAALIREKDISENIQHEKKYRKLIRATEQLSEKLNKYNGYITPYSPSMDENKLAIKEIQHRIKNNLQYIASVMNIQARRSTKQEVKEILYENRNRILSLASIYEILTQDILDDKISIKHIISEIVNNINIFLSDDKNINITILGNDIFVNSYIATSIAIVVNELITNAVKHAFKYKTEGKIIVNINIGKRYSSITVEDNGVGFDINNINKSNLGLSLVKLIVTEQLKGKVQVISNINGSKINFDFKLDVL